MSDEIFKWMPHLFGYETVQKYRTLVSEMENGIEQRQSMWQRPCGTWKFNFNISMYSPETRQKFEDEVLTFFNTCKGAFDNFYIPSWELEYVLGTSIVVGIPKRIFFGNINPASLGFSAVRGEQGNFLFICDRW